MAEIPKPVEVLELQHGEAVTFHVERWEKGQLTIFPAHAPQGKLVDVIRVHVKHTDKEHFPYYYDLTASSLVAQIEPQLRRTDYQGITFRVTAFGFGAKKRFSLDINPAVHA